MLEVIAHLIHAVRGALRGIHAPTGARRDTCAARRVRALQLIVSSAVCIVSMPSNASLSIVGTRFVFPGDAKTLAIGVRNVGDAPVLVQTWLDDGKPDANPATIRVPFMLAPPIFRLDPMQKRAIRVQYIEGGLATDRESLFWINVLELPASASASDGDRTLRVVYRVRMKLLFRPVGLAGAPDGAPDALHWAIDRPAADAARLVATNPSPYYVALTRVELGGAPPKPVSRATDVPPFGRVEWPVHDDLAEFGTVVYEAVRDDGSLIERRAPLEQR
ncbi:molecular chaperone [Burkholderia stagnalis]|uniref:Molecular chaperone n=1 Tax=Burkholderia stagnalis TaxID=1503054 RepID=A0A107ZYI5_9BURK|nr:fimbria/pilus periplasmic chaperone [Burkholderia stagnalis]KVZ02766.1 hypothetical protein WT35_32350 [Burkholderia stagnalis]KWA57800.1 hypothetical protein WT42_08010 [Burkholderia stagnalis]KWA58995.1 hypothetical protein WT44_22960 [Burkholderia stagnalis]KWA60884.1 hypothetical protein WT43_16175 [Burkholderia stagnalis]KWC97760.1 hypothetical protein WT46_27040 [Burkholderia stagnalis]